MKSSRSCLLLLLLAFGCTSPTTSLASRKPPDAGADADAADDEDSEEDDGHEDEDDECELPLPECEDLP